ncbi:MAG: hypothetical protein ACOC80_09650, partial [Petrotogales bacterium]
KNLSKNKHSEGRFYAIILLANYIAAYIVHTNTYYSFQLYSIKFNDLISLIKAGEYSSTVRIISNPAVRGIQYFMTTVIGFPEMLGYIAMFFIGIIYIAGMISLLSWTMNKI